MATPRESAHWSRERVKVNKLKSAKSSYRYMLYTTIRARPPKAENILW